MYFLTYSIHILKQIPQPQREFTSECGLSMNKFPGVPCWTLQQPEEQRGEEWRLRVSENTLLQEYTANLPYSFLQAALLTDIYDLSPFRPLSALKWIQFIRWGSWQGWHTSLVQRGTCSCWTGGWYVWDVTGSNREWLRDSPKSTADMHKWNESLLIHWDN